MSLPLPRADARQIGQRQIGQRQHDDEREAMVAQAREKNAQAFAPYGAQFFL
jgi:hypothetical protein